MAVVEALILVPFEEVKVLGSQQAKVSFRPTAAAEDRRHGQGIFTRL